MLVYYQDEARFGQHGTITRVWAKVGTRPRAILQTQYDSLYVCPETGDACGLITPKVNTESMNVFLLQFARELPADGHAVMMLDQAGWHTAKASNIPANVTLVAPAYQIVGAESDREFVALSSQPLLVQSAVQNVARSQVRRR